MKDYHEFQGTVVAELEEFLGWVGPDTTSEACELLVRLQGYPDPVSDEFEEALQKEIEAQVKTFKEDYEFREWDEEVPASVIHHKELEYKG